MNAPVEEIKLYNANNEVVEVDDALAVKAEKKVNGAVTENATKNENGEWDWKPVEPSLAGGKKRRSSKKSKKGGKKSSKKSSKKAKRSSKKTRKH
jgi:hypothetical protein